MSDCCVPDDSRATDTTTFTTAVAEAHRTTYAVSGRARRHGGDRRIVDDAGYAPTSHTG